MKREQLFEEFDRTQGHVFLSAQSGYGKTEAVKTYLKERSMEAFWHDCTGNEPPSFMETAQKELLKGRVLVLDGFERMKSHRLLQSVSEQLLRSENRVFFLSRHQPPKEFARISAAGKLGLFLQEDLRIPETELGREVYLATEGCPVAVRFYEMQKKHTEPVTQEQLFAMTPLSDYMENEIFAGLGAGERSFLVNASVVDELTREMCEQVLELPDSRKNLYRLTRKNLLSVSWKEQQEVWKMDGLLLLYLRQRFEPTVTKFLLQKIARFYLNKRQYAPLLLFVERNRSVAGFLLEYGGIRLIQEGEMDVFGKIYQYSKGQTLSIPALEVSAEYHYRTGEYQELFACLNQADSYFGSENKYSAYRTLYRGLLQFAEEPEKYEKYLNHVCFYLSEKQEPLPYLTEKHQKLLKYVQLEKDSAAKSSQKPLQVKVFGGFSLKITAESQEIAWRTKKGSELFAYLFSQRERPVERKQILSALWGDEIPNSAVSMLHNMIYNLRKELSAYKLEQVIISQNKKYSLDFNLLSSDYDKIANVIPFVENKNLEKLYPYRGLFENYWGTYMEDFDSYWAQEQRAFYDKIYEEGAMLLAEDCMEKGDYAEAKLLLRGVLNQNPYSEKIMTKLLLCLKELSEFIGVKKEYKIFKDRLLRELNIRPGEELERIFEQIIRCK